MLYPTANRLCGMSMPDLIAALVAFRAKIAREEHDMTAIDPRRLGWQNQEGNL